MEEEVQGLQQRLQKITVKDRDSLARSERKCSTQEGVKEDIAIPTPVISTITLTCKIKDIIREPFENLQHHRKGKFNNCVSEKKKFEIDGIQYRMTPQIFSNGSIQITGLKNLQNIEKIVQKIIHDFGQEIKQEEVFDIVPRTINSTTHCNYEFINLTKLFETLQKNKVQCRYQSTFYSGLIVMIYMDSTGKARYEQCPHCKEMERLCFKDEYEQDSFEMITPKQIKQQQISKYFYFKEVEYRDDERQLKRLREYKEFYNSLQKKPTIKIIQKNFQQHCYKATLTLFQTGSITITGTRRIEDKDRIIEMFIEFLKKNYRGLTEDDIIRRKK